MISFGITNTELNKTKRNHNSKKYPANYKTCFES